MGSIVEVRSWLGSWRCGMQCDQPRVPGPVRCLCDSTHPLSCSVCMSDPTMYCRGAHSQYASFAVLCCSVLPSGFVAWATRCVWEENAEHTWDFHVSDECRHPREMGGPTRREARSEATGHGGRQTQLTGAVWPWLLLLGPRGPLCSIPFGASRERPLLRVWNVSTSMYYRFEIRYDETLSAD